MILTSFRCQNLSMEDEKDDFFNVFCLHMSKKVHLKLASKNMHGKANEVCKIKKKNSKFKLFWQNLTRCFTQTD